MSISEKEFNTKIVETVVSLSSDASVDLTQEALRADVEMARKFILNKNPEASDYPFDIVTLVERILRLTSVGTSIHTIEKFKNTNHEEWLGLKRQRIDDGVHWNAFRILCRGNFLQTN